MTHFLCGSLNRIILNSSIEDGWAMLTSNWYRNFKTTLIALFHDVNLLPANDSLLPYNECDRPIQLGSELEHWGWGVPYKNSAGGVVSMHLRHWNQINGFSNDFEGWGGGRTMICLNKYEETTC